MFGITLFDAANLTYFCFSLCGKPPFKGKNYYDLLKKNYLCEYKFNFKYWHNVSEEGSYFLLETQLTIALSNSEKPGVSNDGPLSELKNNN